LTSEKLWWEGKALDFATLAPRFVKFCKELKLVN
jgi:hypothetical protein